MLCATSKIRLFWRRYPSYYEADYGNGNRHSLINSNYYYDLFKYGMNMPSGKINFQRFASDIFRFYSIPAHILCNATERNRRGKKKKKKKEKSGKRGRDEEGKNE